AFRKLKLKAEYKIFDVKPENLNDFLNGILRSDINGLNVTVPYKQDVYKFLKKYGKIDSKAERSAGINTIVIRNKSLFGYNTDTVGFMKSLKKDLRFDPRMKNIFIFGAGGAGSALALKLGRTANKIFIFDIDSGKTKKFIKKFMEYFGKSKLAVVKNKEADMRNALKESHLLVNATPFGMKKNEMLVNPDFLHKGLKVFDLIYKPGETPIMKAARKSGIKAVNGLGMLLYQGAASLQFWTGRKAAIETMHRALLGALKR
ncbi:MAG: hypothetical protein KAU58_02650, partial [Candidatus Omnitrophica bacterium]|nr:hypothetical protein [Candidatus Omnitrophota bacterium]